jgi:hypothetical protein
MENFWRELSDATLNQAELALEILDSSFSRKDLQTDLITTPSCTSEVSHLAQRLEIENDFQQQVITKLQEQVEILKSTKKEVNSQDRYREILQESLEGGWNQVHHLDREIEHLKESYSGKNAFNPLISTDRSPRQDPHYL